MSLSAPNIWMTIMMQKPRMTAPSCRRPDTSLERSRASTSNRAVNKLS